MSSFSDFFGVGIVFKREFDLGLGNMVFGSLGIRSLSLSRDNIKGEYFSKKQFLEKNQKFVIFQIF